MKVGGTTLAVSLFLNNKESTSKAKINNIISAAARRFVPVNTYLSVR